jgi:hypothetical protein
MRQISVIASLTYGALVGLAAIVPFQVLAGFAENVGIPPWQLATVPGMLALLYALVLYQDAGRRVATINQSLWRGVAVALLTWPTFSLLMMWKWCAPGGYGACFRDTLLVSGMVGGGPLLTGALLSAAIVGWIIVHPPQVRRLEE